MIKATVNGTSYEITSVKGKDASGNSVTVPLTEEFTGTKTITSNGTHNVAGFLNAIVNVPTGGSSGGSGVTKYASGTFTADKTTGIAIAHGLGVTPNVWGCYLADDSVFTEDTNTNYMSKVYSVFSELQLWLYARKANAEYGTLGYKRPSVATDYVTAPTDTTITFGVEGRSNIVPPVAGAEYVWFAAYVEV